MNTKYEIILDDNVEEAANITEYTPGDLYLAIDNNSLKFIAYILVNTDITSKVSPVDIITYAINGNIYTFVATISNIDTKDYKGVAIEAVKKEKPYILNYILNHVLDDFGLLSFAKDTKNIDSMKKTQVVKIL